MRLNLFSLLVIFGFVSNAQSWVDGMQDHRVNFYKVQQQFSDHWKGKDTDQKGNGFKQRFYFRQGFVLLLTVYDYI